MYAKLVPLIGIFILFTNLILLAFKFNYKQAFAVHILFSILTGLLLFPFVELELFIFSAGIFVIVSIMIILTRNTWTDITSK